MVMTRSQTRALDEMNNLIRVLDSFQAVIGPWLEDIDDQEGQEENAAEGAGNGHPNEQGENAGNELENPGGDPMDIPEEDNGEDAAEGQDGGQEGDDEDPEEDPEEEPEEDPEEEPEEENPEEDPEGGLEDELGGAPEGGFGFDFEEEPEEVWEDEDPMMAGQGQLMDYPEYYTVDPLEYSPVRAEEPEEPPEPLFPRKSANPARDAVFREMKNPALGNRARMRPWETLMETGPLPPMRIVGDERLLRVGQRCWEDVIWKGASTKGTSAEENENEKRWEQYCRRELWQINFLLCNNGQVLNPHWFDADFLDKYCLPPTPPE